MQSIRQMNYGQEPVFSASVKNNQVLRSLLEHASDHELSRFNSVLDVMPLRLDGKVYNFAEMFSNGIHQLCMNDVIRDMGRLKSWHSTDLAEGRILEEIYPKSLKRANDILSKIYTPAEAKNTSREISLAEIYSKLVN